MVDELSYTMTRAARLAMPTASPDVALRGPVLELLATAAGRVAVVCAPAGYGKTSHVAAWAEQDGRPAAWADVEPGDDGPGALLPLLADLLQSVTDFDAAQLPSTQLSAEQYATVVAPALGRIVRRCTRPFILILDDVHLIENQAAIDLLDSLVRNVPAPSTVVLIGRAAPSASLARLRVDPGIVEITSEHLGLAVPEATAVLEALGASLPEKEVEQLVQDAEGWPVGIRLAGLAMRDDATVPASAFTGPDRAIADYVHEEWLRGLPADDIEFLMKVSGIDWLSGPICDRMLDRFDSAERLERLAARRLIVIPVDRRGEYYRLHHLLRQVLNAEFERVDHRGRRLLDVRASEWFEIAGDIDRAVDHAVRGEDLVRAERLVVEHAPSYHTNGRYARVSRWLSTFPRAYVMKSASLCLISSVTALGVGDSETTAAWIRFGEEALSHTPPEDDATIGLEIAAFRAAMHTTTIGDALDDAGCAYRDLPPGIWHSVACLAYGSLSFAIGDDEVATAVLGEGATEAQLVGAPTLEAQCRAHLALVLGTAEDWGRATPLARSARQLLRDHGLEGMPSLVLVTAVSALVETMSGHPQLGRADIDLTRQNLASLSTVSGWANIQSRIALARASLLLGDRTAARTCLDEAEAHLRTQPDASRPKAQLAALAEQLRAARVALPYGPSSLTTAELRVLHYLPTNLTQEQIAKRLFVSRNTAKSHAAAVYRKLGASSRSEAVGLARAAGLLPEEDDVAAGAHDGSWTTRPLAITDR